MDLEQSIIDSLSNWDEDSFKCELYQFYGVDANSFRISFGGEKITLEAVEDPDDGYRSYLECIRVSKENNLIFNNIPYALIKIVITNDSGYQGFEFRGFDDDHVWLRVGTNLYDDYYPYFVFEYTPKEK